MFALLCLFLACDIDDKWLLLLTPVVRPLTQILWLGGMDTGEATPQTRNLTLSREAHSSSFYVYVTRCVLHEYENLCYLRNTHFIFWDGVVWRVFALGKHWVLGCN